MAVFTATQADAAKVVRCESETIGGTHDHYVFGVSHNGSYYEWEDTTLTAGATKSQIKTAVKDYLVTIEKQSTPTVKANIPDSLGIIGSTVGSL